MKNEVAFAAVAIGLIASISGTVITASGIAAYNSIQFNKLTRTEQEMVIKLKNQGTSKKTISDNIRLLNECQENLKKVKAVLEQVEKYAASHKDDDEAIHRGKNSMVITHNVGINMGGGVRMIPHTDKSLFEEIVDALKLVKNSQQLLKELNVALFNNDLKNALDASESQLNMFITEYSLGR